ncbi:MAG: hypothetical protein GY830_06185 [Bacteroidetes bacterium]|nr:hypothetical protein [Bacteroidota bacterium]
MKSLYKYLKIYFLYLIILSLSFNCSIGHENHIKTNKNIFAKGYEAIGNTLSKIKTKSNFVRPKKPTYKILLDLFGSYFAYQILSNSTLVNSDSNNNGIESSIDFSEYDIDVFNNFGMRSLLQTPTISPITTSINPSITPSQSPSTDNPSFVPSNSPSTDNPSLMPSSPPISENPTNNPTINPTFEPTLNPTNIPANYPTVPTLEPTMYPTPNATLFKKYYINSNLAFNDSLKNDSIVFNKGIFNDIITLKGNRLAATGYFNIKSLSSLVFSIFDLEGNPLDTNYLSSIGDNRGITIIDSIFEKDSLSILQNTNNYSINNLNYDIGLIDTYYNGSIKNHKIFQRNDTTYSNHFIINDDKYYIGGFTNDFPSINTRKSFLLSIDSSFNKLFAKKYYYKNSVFHVTNHLLALDKGIGKTGRVTLDNNGNKNTNLFILTFDENGTNDINICLEQENTQEGLLMLDFKDFIINAGYSVDSFNNSDIIVNKVFKKNKTVDWNYVYRSKNDNRPFSILKEKNGLITISGESREVNSNKKYIFLMSILPNSTLIKSKLIDGVYDSAKKVIEAQDQTIAIIGNGYLEDYDIDTFVLTKLINSDFNENCFDLDLEKTQVDFNVSSPDLIEEDLSFDILNITNINFDKIKLNHLEKGICLTQNPTIDPTMEPTLNPTTVPTINPTIEPTNEPTEIPSSNPTKMPTLFPSFGPIYNHTLEPSSSPLNEPSNSPSNEPSNSPSNKPSDIPTDSPTNILTNNPSNDPSLSPTIKTTSPPSKSPSFTLIPSFKSTKAKNIIGHNNTYIYINSTHIKTTTSGNESTIAPTMDPNTYKNINSTYIKPDGNESTISPTKDPSYIDHTNYLTEVTYNLHTTTESSSKESKDSNPESYIIPIVIVAALLLCCCLCIVLTKINNYLSKSGYETINNSYYNR